VTGNYVTSWRLRNIVSVPQTYKGDPEQCRRVDDSPDDPGISNALRDSSDARAKTGRETGFEKRRACGPIDGAAPGKLINDSRKLIKGRVSSEIS
jgi:hypothetical protein